MSKMAKTILYLVFIFVLSACNSSGNADGDIVDGDMSDGDVLDSDTSDGDVIDDDTSDGNASEEETSEGDEGDGDSDPEGEKDEAEPISFDFTVVALPDTQKYSATYPEVYMDQTEWVVNNAEKEKIAFVTHLGDIVHNYEVVEQWDIARAAMDKLDAAGIPYGLALGNHDHETGTTEGCSADPVPPCGPMYYIENFGPDRYSGESWYGGASPTALSNYQILTIADREFIFLHLRVDSAEAEVQWAEQVLDDHPQAAVALSTHRYLLDWRMTEEMGYPFSLIAAGRVNNFITSLIQPFYYEDSWNAEKLFQEFISKEKQIYMVQCGHYDAEYYQVSQNSFDLPVHEMLVDFQSLPQGGEGYMRLLRYDLEGGRIHVQTYSPTLDRFHQDGEGFDFGIELLWKFFEKNRDIVADITDIEEVEAQLEYWTETEEGREEYYQILYSAGSRDSEFSFDIDFNLYRQGPE